MEKRTDDWVDEALGWLVWADLVVGVLAGLAFVTLVWWVLVGAPE